MMLLRQYVNAIVVGVIIALLLACGGLVMAVKFERNAVVRAERDADKATTALSTAIGRANALRKKARAQNDAVLRKLRKDAKDDEQKIHATAVANFLRRYCSDNPTVGMCMPGNTATGAGKVQGDEGDDGKVGTGLLAGGCPRAFIDEAARTVRRLNRWQTACAETPDLCEVDDATEQ